jgi:hypothetical protein
VVNVCVPAKLPHSGASDPVKEFSDTIAVNLIGAYALSQFTLPHMPAGTSSIIHMSSTRAHQSEPDTAGYSASKAGLCGLTHSQVAFSVKSLSSMFTWSIFHFQVLILLQNFIENPAEVHWLIICLFALAGNYFSRQSASEYGLTRVDQHRWRG